MGYLQLTDTKTLVYLIPYITITMKNILKSLWKMHKNE